MFSRTVLSGAGFAADAYDLFVINLVLKIMADIYPQTIADASLVSTTALVGSVFGQLFFGFMADKIGRKAIFVTTLSFMVVGCLGSGLITASGPLDGYYVYIQLAAWRFLLGFGVGGEYPLSATVTQESHGNVSAVFAMQGVGSLVSSLVVLVLLWMNIEQQMVWRAALCFGALPGILACGPRCLMLETEEYIQHKSTVQRQNPWMFHLKREWRPLLGTALSWFLFDVFFYANSLFSATITQAMGLGQTLEEQAQNALYVGLIAFPGYLLSIAFLKKIGIKNLQLFGFFMCAVLFGILGGFLASLKSIPILLLALYGCTFLFSNFGPNATTFIAPVEIFHVSVRATFHGVSAASGKIGAIVGASLLKPVYASFGLPIVLAICAGGSLLGFIVTWLLIPAKIEHPSDQEPLQEKEVP